MREVLHAEVSGFNFSADMNLYQRRKNCDIVAGQITERPHDVKTVWRRSVPLLSTSRTVARSEASPIAPRYVSKFSPP